MFDTAVSREAFKFFFRDGTNPKFWIIVTEADGRKAGGKRAVLLIDAEIIVNAQRSDCHAYNDGNPHITRKQKYSIEQPSSAPDLATTKLRSDFS